MSDIIAKVAYEARRVSDATEWNGSVDHDEIVASAAVRATIEHLRDNVTDAMVAAGFGWREFDCPEYPGLEGDTKNMAVLLHGAFRAMTEQALKELATQKPVREKA